MNDEIERLVALMMIGDGEEMRRLIAIGGLWMFDVHVHRIARKFAEREGEKAVNNFKRNEYVLQRESRTQKAGAAA